MGPRPFSRGNYDPYSVESVLEWVLQWGHGLSAVEMSTSGVPVNQSFELQWGHGLSAVEISTPSAPSNISAGSFNGATAFQPWKFVRRRCRSLEYPAASMGPRPFSRGNAIREGLNLRGVGRGFNGATAFQPWKWFHVPLHMNNNNSFNGATAFQPWKWQRGKDRLAVAAMLQWGHGLSAVEM